IEVVDPVGKLTTTQYTSRNLPAVTVEGAGTPLARTTTYRYDLLGRVLEETLTSLTEPDRTSTITYGYDILGRRTSIGGDRSYATSVSYDASDRVLSRTDALNRITSFVYDSRGLLTSVSLNGNLVESYGYDLV